MNGRIPARGSDGDTMDGGATAIWAFQGHGAGQVSAREGEVLQVLARDNPEWWYVRTEAGEGYMPASYVQLRVDDGDAESEAGSMASTSTASAQSSTESAVTTSSLSRFMKSAHGRKKRLHVQQQEQRAGEAAKARSGAASSNSISTEVNAEALAEVAATKTTSSPVPQSNATDNEVKLLKEAHAQALAKLQVRSKELSAAHEAEITQLRASLYEATEQHELDQLELKAAQAALSAAEDATFSTRQANEHLKAAAAEHMQTEIRLREEIESLRSQLETSRDELARLRTANPPIVKHPSNSKTTPAQDGPQPGATVATSGDGTSTRPQSAPANRAALASRARWTALDASEIEPSAGSHTQNSRSSSGNAQRSGRLTKQRRGNLTGSRLARQTNVNMRPQSAPARHSVALSELSTMLLPGNPPEAQIMMTQRRRHYSKPPPNGAKIACVGLGAAAATTAKQQQIPDSTSEKAYALANAVSDFSSAIHDTASFNPTTLTAHASSDPGGAVSSSKAAVASAKQLQKFENRLASLLTAPGSRRRTVAPPEPAAVWARLQKVG